MMKSLHLISVALVLSMSSFCQYSKKVDSLNRILFTSSVDSLKGLAIVALCREFVYTKPDSCLYYSNLGFDLIKNPLIKKQFESFDDYNLHSFENIIYASSGIALSELRSDSLAVRLGLTSLQLAEKSNNKKARDRALGSLGEIYQNIGEPGTSLDYERRALERDENRHDSLVHIASIGACFYELGQYDSALYYLHKIDVDFQVTKNKPWPYPDNYLGNTYSKKGDYIKAISFYKSAVRKSIESQFTQDLSRAYAGLSNVFNLLGKIDSGVVYAKMSLHIAGAYSFPDLSLNASNLLASLYESKGLIDSAFKYQKISNALRDTLFNKEKIQQVQSFTFIEKLRQKDLDQEKTAYQNKVKLYALLTVLFVMILFAVFLLRNNRQKQKSNLVLEKTLSTLKSTQSQLIQSEKMASLGELTAGIAHEIQNPLNFVNNFSEVSTELVDEMYEEIDKGNLKDAKEIANDLKQNLEKINHHGKRAGDIVKGMLQHSQSSSRVKEPTNINKLADEYLRLAYQGLRAKDKTFNAILKTDFDETIGNINIIPQDIGRVILNLINNAFYAVNEKKTLRQAQGDSYDPTVSVSTKKIGDKVFISVIDNGNGVPQKIVDKIFQPFFTTKPTGQGTGLGLSLSYDIVKAHGGELKVETKEGEGTEFVIVLPIV